MKDLLFVMLILNKTIISKISNHHLNNYAYEMTNTDKKNDRLYCSITCQKF